VATARCQQFVIEGDTGLVRQQLAAALEPRFTVVQEARGSARQTWLDTFDWRLHAAGLVLRQVTQARSAELVLCTAAGRTVATVPLRGQRWPRLIDVIPAGPLRDRLGPLVDVRALLPLAHTEGTLTRLRVLDGERKTVARITLDAASLVRPVKGALPARLALAPVRGYQADADRAGRLIAEHGGFTPGPDPAFPCVAAAAGRQTGHCAGRPDAALSPATPARTALAGVLAGLADTMTANVEYVLRDVDIEFLHDLRVAVRRTRSVLKLAGDALPGGLAERFAPEFKWLGDLTAPTRDLDVYLAGFDAMAAGLTAASAADLGPLRAHLARRRRAERRRLVRGLRSARFAELMAGWPAALDGAAGPAAGREPAVGSLAGDRIARAYRRVARRGLAITAAQAAAGPPAEELHSLRKRCKELRYLLEFFSSLYEPAAYRRAVRYLRGLQDVLGVFQDGEVQRDAIRGFAAEMVAAGAPAGTGQPAAGQPAELAATLLAMGELTAQLHARQDRARDQLAARFAEFARAGGVRTLGIAPRAASA
jgi:CHAD domain-containing protein